MSDSSVIYAIEFPDRARISERSVRIGGWCFDASGDPLRGIRASIGPRTFVGRRKLPRLAVGAQFPQVPEAAMSGFEIEIELPRGRSRVAIACKRHDGSWQPLHELVVRTPRWRWAGRERTAPTPEQLRYELWVQRYDQPDAAALDLMRAKAATMPPLAFSIIIDARGAHPREIRDVLRSVGAQVYPRWDATLVVDRPPPRRSTAPIDRAGGERVGIRTAPVGGLDAEFLNQAWRETGGDVIVLLERGASLAPHALMRIACEFLARPGLRAIYADHDHTLDDGRRVRPFFKPEFDPDLLAGIDYVSPLSAFTRDSLKATGGFEAPAAGMRPQIIDRFFRVAELFTPRAIARLPHVLSHRRSEPGDFSPSPAAESGSCESVIRIHCARTGTPVDAVESAGSGRLRTIHSLTEPPAVAIIVPTRNFLHLLRVCVESILTMTEYPDFRIYVVDNDSDDPAALEFLEAEAREGRIRVLPAPGPFHYARLNNEAVKSVTEPVVALVNNDIEVTDGGWLREMVSHAVRPEIGAVGARLLYPDGRIQHSGVLVGAFGVAGHYQKGVPDPAPVSPFPVHDCVRRVSAVTAACLVVERAKFLEVGGFQEEHFAVGCNDIDLCLRLDAAGYHSLFTPFARLVHHESASRERDDASAESLARAREEHRAFVDRWPERIADDPCYNPNLSLDAEDDRLDFPPRVLSPWDAAARL